MKHPILHGTDGIRGKISASPKTDLEALEAIVQRREVNGRAFMVIGEAIGQILAEELDDYPKVVIGWDRRPGNAMLVSGLTDGLHSSSVRVIHAGMVATPGLHDAVLGTKSDAGLMVTASHNPHTDSGVKFFDANGRKSMPSLERRIADLAWQIAERGINPEPDPESCLPDRMIHAERGHRSTLAKRLDSMADFFRINVSNCNWKDIIGSDLLLLDSSGGAATNWLAAGLERRGIPVKEISSLEKELNDQCGAGELSPTDSWTWAEMIDSKHLLLKSLAENHSQNIPKGSLIGAALDGDGDRCLLIETTENGARVIDGDEMADNIARAWDFVGVAHATMAFSIETDLSLTSSDDRFRMQVNFLECAVGDRWLSNQLSKNWIDSKNWPSIIGAEDSGHIVMASPHPEIENKWSLVGDGAATLISQLLVRALQHHNERMAPTFKSGWKKRTSIIDSDRAKWTGDGKLADSVESMIIEYFGQKNCSLSRKSIEGETSLLLLSGNVNSVPISVGIRNSGTQEKTSITLRSMKDLEGLNELLKLIVEFLTKELVHSSSSDS
tara:strand:+ start:886 stop:2553 length:1668 start_codon:yes stop_codon:yes gene_type:complete